MASEAMLAASDADPTETDVMEAIANRLRYMSTGDRAALRRLFLTQSRSADGVVVKLLHGAGVTPPAGDAEFARWQLLCHVAAVLAGTGAVQAHVAKRRVGTALHAARVSENRVLRLLAARGPALHDQIVRAARVLAQAGEAPINLWTVFDLAGPDRVRAEAARVAIAKDYYAARARSEGETK